MSFSSCLCGVQGEDEIWGMRCGVLPPAPWGSHQGEEGKWYLLVWWKHIQAPSIAAEHQPYIVLRYINSVKGNSFQRRVCSCNFSQNCEGNSSLHDSGLYVCLFVQLLLSATQLKLQIFLQRKFGLQGKEEGIGTDPSFTFSIATAQQQEQKLK